jgi:Kae1-associated kinase Bud32
MVDNMSSKCVSKDDISEIMQNISESQIISRGAEATIYSLDDKIIKVRVKKSYRLSKLDNEIRESRTSREAKVLQKLSNVIDVPKLFGSSSDTIIMEKISGDALKNILSKKNYGSFSKLIAENISRMHDQGIIHGDLTTSNMIYDDSHDKLYFIDFGLSFFSYKVEDKAVDLHLLFQAIESRHFEFYPVMRKKIIEYYSPKDRNLVLERLEVVDARGRNKNKGE